MAKVMTKEARHTQRRDRASGVPLEILEHPRGNPACRGTFGGRRKAVRDRLALQGGKDSDAGRDWGQEEKGMTEDEMVGWRLHRERKGSQPACVLKPLFGRNGLASPKGDLQICSEVGNSRGRVQGPDCPLPTLQRHS